MPQEEEEGSVPLPAVGGVESWDLGEGVDWDGRRGLEFGKRVAEVAAEVWR